MHTKSFYTSIFTLRVLWSYLQALLYYPLYILIQINSAGNQLFFFCDRSELKPFVEQ